MPGAVGLETHYHLYRHQASGREGVLQNDNGTITSLVSKDAVQAYEIGELVEKTFEGSLPAFVAAFTKHQNISEEELDEVQRMIDRIRKGGK